ncbi:hypothetical protein IJT93_11780 [bacterium]|nr:hypothetical protein [bacterium]
MSSAYVPGLTVSDFMELKLERRLPLKGKVVVKVGQKVSWNTVVANTLLPGRVELVNVASKLGIAPEEVLQAMRRKEGEAFEKDELLAQSKGLWGFFKSNLYSPITGTLESVSEVSGLAVLRAPASPVEVNAYVNGEIAEVMEDEGVVVRTQGAFLQGIFGIGGESAGEICMFCKSPSEETDINALSREHCGKILIGGSYTTCAFLKKAVECGVKAVVVGGISDRDLKDFLGYDLGVAITGSEQVGLTLILTEGFGRINMAERTFRLLQANSGRWASVSGATQIRAGVIRPEIIIPLSERPERSENAEKAEGVKGLAVGAAVRLIREPHFGELAEVVSLPPEPELIPTGAKVRVAELKLEGGEVMRLPRANLELIEN